MPLLLKFNLTNFFSFNCSDASFSVVSWEYSDGLVFLTVNYTTDLEDKEAKVQFTFDQLFIRLPPIQLEFTM